MKNKSLYMLSLCLLLPRTSKPGGKVSRPSQQQPAAQQPAAQEATQTQTDAQQQEEEAELETTPLPAATTARAATADTGEAVGSPIASKNPVIPQGTITCNFNDPKNIRPLFSKLNDGASLKAFDQSFKHSNIWFINASYETMKSTIEDTAFNKGKITNLPFEKKSFAQAKAEGRLAEFELYEWLIVKPYNPSRDRKNKFMSEPILLVLIDFNQSATE